VHVLDFSTGQAHTAVTPATGGFRRLTGRIVGAQKGSGAIPFGTNAALVETDPITISCACANPKAFA
jgi:hypothetical protein